MDMIDLSGEKVDLLTSKHKENRGNQPVLFAVLSEPQE